MFSLFMLDVEEWLYSLRDKIKYNPLYLIPYVFLIAVILFALMLGFGVFVLPGDGLPP